MCFNEEICLPNESSKIIQIILCKFLYFDNKFSIL